MILSISKELYDEMQTQAYWIKKSAKVKLATLKDAKMGSWYDGWKPYCGYSECRLAPRMTERDYGFECCACKNQIGFDLKRLKESPTNWTK